MVNFCYGEKNVFLDVLGSFWSTKTRKTTFLCMLLFSKGHNRRDNRSRSILDLNPIQEHHWNLHGLNIYKTKHYDFQENFRACQKLRKVRRFCQKLRTLRTFWQARKISWTLKCFILVNIQTMEISVVILDRIQVQNWARTVVTTLIYIFKEIKNHQNPSKTHKKWEKNKKCGGENS